MPFVLDNSVVSGWYLAKQIRSLPIEVDREPVPCSELLALSLRFGLSTYDAASLELALRRQVPIATQDEALRAAARAAGVGVVEA